MTRARRSARGNAIASRALTWTLVVALVLGMFSPLIGLTADTRQAHAASASVHLWKIGNIQYTDGNWNAHIFRADDGNGETVAYCVEPEKNSPPEGNYVKAEINCVSNRNHELRADLWFVYGGPGFDKSMWPATNWDGNPMTDEDYYLASHILLSDTYVSNLTTATHGAGQRFRDWVSWYVTGYDLITGHLVNDGAVGRQALARAGEVSPRFEAYQIYGGANQNIAASSFYRPYGNLRIDKDSSNPEVTSGNPNYTMKGIRYGIYTRSDCAEASSTGKVLVLDESGCAEATDLREGTYYVREIADSVAGTGYAHDASVYACDVVGDQTSTVRAKLDASSTSDGVYDDPITEVPLKIVQKYDVLTQSPVPSGDASMADARFEVRFFANANGSTSGDPTRTWVFKTDEEGKIDLRDDDSFVSGDALFRDPRSGSVLFPLGTYATREIGAPGSYEPVADGKPRVFTITATGIGKHDTNGASSASDVTRTDETPIRHDLGFTKRDADTQRPMANIPFLVSRVRGDGGVIEEHVVVTDANGSFDSSISHASHTTRTNANDAAVSKHSNGSYAVDESMLDADAGVWFGIAYDGSWIAADDAYGAFPDSTSCTYVFKELPVKANRGKALVRFEAYAHAARSTSIDLGTVHNCTPTLATVARDKVDGDKLVSRNKDACVVDSISYSGLVAGQTYWIEGRLVDAASGDTISDKSGNPASASAFFTATATSGAIELEFSFDATSVADGAQLVVCETLYEGERILATHDDLADGSQTVTVVQPALTTQAADAIDGDSVIMGDVDATIVDTVRYTGLTPGAVYALTALVMDQASGQPFNAPSGPVTARTTFIPEDSNGTQDISLTFDATGLDTDAKLVVFERLAQDDVDIAAHEDIDDANQTVTVRPPSIETQAKDADDGDNVVSADTRTTIVDTVRYADLAPGREYALTASLVNKETGRPICDAFGQPVIAQHAFVPVERSGSTDVTLEFDASAMDVETGVVVFEELSRDGRHVASHVDLNSASQTIVIDLPSIRTFASVDGTSQEMMREDDVPLLDAVSYRNLKAGERYTLTGTVMSKQTGEPLIGSDGDAVASICEFVPEAGDGTATVTFSVDALGLAEGDQLVVFERLCKDGTVLATHEDMNDPCQTLTVGTPSISTVATSKNDTKDVVRDTASIVVDTVSYTGLAPNREYRLEGRIVDKATGSPLSDASGVEVTSSATFIPQLTAGTTTLSFGFDASELEEGSELVVFEKLYRGDVEIASHEDVFDEGQTVRIVPCSIMTLASDPRDGDKIVSAFDDARIQDSVSYSGLEPGVEYRFVGTLMDKGAEAPLLSANGSVVSGTTTFTPRTSEGTIDVEFAFDATNAEEARDVVIFQELYQDDSLLATHADYGNAAQTVTLEAPRISTSAADAEDGDKELNGEGIVTIVDVVTYAGLVAGEEYEVDGILMIDDGTLSGTPITDAMGRQVTAHASFTPEAAHGSVDVSFQLDATLLDKKAHVVVFEKLYHERTLIAQHCDIHDEDQTVHMPEGAPALLGEIIPDDPNPLAGFGSVAKMGDRAIYALMACAIIGSCAFGLLVILRRKAFGARRQRE